jgi:hypothetical protein
MRTLTRIAKDPDILVIGSQSVLGTWPDDRLPSAATASLEADVAFFDDPDDRKADLDDGAIGESSPFHETSGFYAEGVSVSTAVLPRGWQDRLVVLDTAATAPGRGHLLEPHDCVVSKLVAGREEVHVFAHAPGGEGRRGRGPRHPRALDSRTRDRGSWSHAHREASTWRGGAGGGRQDRRTR